MKTSTNPSLPPRHQGRNSNDSNSPRTAAERGGDKTIQAVLDLEQDRHQLLQSMYSSRSVLHHHEDSTEPSLEFSTTTLSPDTLRRGSAQATSNDSNRHRRQGGNATNERNINAILKLEEDTNYHFLQYSSRSFRK